MKLLLLLFGLFAGIGLQAQGSKFCFSEKQLMLDFKLLHHAFSANELPKDTTLFGQLLKDDKSVTFYFFRPTEQGIDKVRIEIDPYAFILENGEHWGFLEAHLTTSSGYEKVEGCKFTIVANTEDIIRLSLSESLTWFTPNKANFDLNGFKQTERYKRSSMHYLDSLNLNNTPFKTSTELTFIDLKSGLVGIDMGKHQLQVTEIRGDFLSFHLLYDFRRREVRQVYVHNTGYFLE